MNLARLVMVGVCLPLLGFVSQGPQGAQAPDGCKVCKVGDIPTYDSNGWSNFGSGAPAVTVKFLNPKRENGQCTPPDDCVVKKCKFSGTLQIHNTGPATLTNAQISVNGVLVSVSGALAIGAKRKVDYPEDAPLEVACGMTSEVEFSITSGVTVFNSVLQLKCGGECPPPSSGN